jgi:prepilin-type N-terminal cleavage/methylation domain-containing protein
MKRGFTLIELMVSVTIFSIVMVISMGALLSISGADKKAESIKTVMNNLSFALDSMSRSIRTGTLYHCGSGNSDCVNGSTQIDFLPVEGPRMYYKFDTSKNNCNQPTLTTGGCIMRDIGDGSGYQAITAPEVVITNLKFYLIGSSASDTTQAKVALTLSGFIRVSGNPTTMSDCITTPANCSVFNIQTSVTQRLYDQ